MEETIESFKAKWIGKKVLIIGEHPHKNKVGEIIDFRRTVVCGWGLVVKSGDEEFFVFKAHNMKVLA